MLSSQTTLDMHTQQQTQRPKELELICAACGHINLLQRRIYYWLLSKEKNARCADCGRPLLLRQ